MWKLNKQYKKDGDNVENVEIGQLIIMKKSKWLKLKEKYPLISQDMEYAVVKEFEEGELLIEKIRLNISINGRQIDENNV